ncbi:DUF1036 domain-containing protein [Bacillus cereus]|nr:DUF1036 domain-containing protein [Bacillus cereus]
MPFKFRNETNLTVWLAAAFYDPTCSGKWRKQGWFRMAPGQIITLWPGPATYSDVYFFARDTNETRKWEGNEYNVDLPLGYMEFSNGLDYYFDRCWNDQVTESNKIRRGLIGIRATADDFTYPIR